MLWVGIVSAVHAALPMVVIASLFFVPAWLLIYGFHIPRMPFGQMGQKASRRP